MPSYHITVGTFGTRLHGGDEPTVEREHNKYGEMFVGKNLERERFERSIMTQNPVMLTEEQRLFAEDVIPPICEQGGWRYHIAACQTNHFHILVSSNTEPKKIRRWLKHWLSNCFNSRFGKQQWFAECGSTKHLFEPGYFEAVYEYIKRQRTTKD